MTYYCLVHKLEGGARVPHETLLEAQEEASRLYDFFGGRYDVSVLQLVERVLARNPESPKISQNRKKRERKRRAKARRASALLDLAVEPLPAKVSEPIVMVKKRRIAVLPQ